MEDKNKKFKSMFQSNTAEITALTQLLKRVDLLEKRVKILEQEHKRLKK